MRTKLRSKLPFLFVMCALLVAVPVVAALADNVVNDVSVTPGTGGQKQVSVAAGQTSALVGYQINATSGNSTDTTGSSGQNCNPAVKAAELTLNGLPAGVSVKDSAGNTLTAPYITFTQCGVEKELKLAVANNVTPGNYTITVADIRNDGYTSADFNENNATFNLVVTADLTAPDTFIDSGPAAGGTESSASASFSFSSNEPNTTFQCKLDSDAFAACTSPKALSGLADGSHTFQVRAIDPAGNIDLSPATRSWTVQTDSTAPVITPDVQGTLGSNGWYTSDVDVSWSVVDNESTITSKSAACDTTTTINSDTAGQTVSCSATSAGGTDTKSVTIKRDATAPQVTLGGVSGTAGTNGWYTSVVTQTFNASDATSGLVGPSSFTKSSGANEEGSSVNIGSGTVSDNAGNTASNSASFKIDLSDPLANCDSAPSGWTGTDVSID